MVIYDTLARDCHLIRNEKLLNGQSVMAIVPLSESRILCSTSIEAPGGGKILAEQAEIFEFDLSKEQVIYALAPIPGSREIAHMKQDAAGIIHGITREGMYFTYDPECRKVLGYWDLSEKGTPVRDGMALAEDGTLYGLLTGGIFCVHPNAGTPEFLPEPPCEIRCGMALTKEKLYFGSRTHLWSCTL